MSVTDGNIGLVRETDIIEEMQGAYLDYAMSVIVSRALPDVRDGLKPVHRRILYAISHDLGLDHTKAHKKSARIVGEVLGKYHPHGDTAVYDAMVRMAQEFSLRYPLVDGQGNFGSVDGDNAAAMRYTEARLAKISQLILTDLEKDTVDWHDNFDNSLSEPDILPASLPNLLVNGASGIAVGMATNVPPHNLGEVVDALTFMIDRYDQLDEVTVEHLMQFVQGPDFPTGGILYRFREEKGDEADAIAQGYSVGKARLIVQAKAHFEEMSRSRSRIVITELPYQTNKMALLERIAYLVRDGKIDGITDLRDESDRTGMRVVLELTRTVEPKDVLADLFKKTPLQQTFGMQMLALVDGEPRLLSLKRILHLFIQHRQEILRRRSEYELRRARERAHIVEGLLRALDLLDDVIDTIRRSQNVETARKNLMRKFSFTQIQAQAILDMQLRRLAALERRKLQEEFKELQKQIAYLEELLANPAKMLAVIKEDLLAMKEEYGDVRRTQIVDRTKGTLTSTDLLPQQDVWVSVGANGDLRRQDVVKLTVSILQRVGKDSEIELLTANTRDFLYLFCKDGRCSRAAIHEIPYNGNNRHVAELTDLTRRDDITAAISLPRSSPEEATGYLFLVTERGMVKRIPLADFLVAAASDPQVMNVDEKDRLRWVLPTVGGQEIMLVSASGQAIRFSEEDVRSMGLAAGGVGGMKLKKGDQVIHAQVVEPQGELLTLTQNGYAKRTSLEQYSSQGRNGGGIVTHKPNAQTGKVAAALMLDGDSPDVLVVVPSKGAVKIVELAKIPRMGRGVQGKRVVDTSNTKPVVAVKAVTEPTASTTTADSESRASTELPVNGRQSAHDGSTNGNLSQGSRPATGRETKPKAVPASGKATPQKEKAEADEQVNLFEATAPVTETKPAAGKGATSRSAKGASESKSKSKSGSTPSIARTTGAENQSKSTPGAVAGGGSGSATVKPAGESKKSGQKKQTATKTKSGSASRSTSGGQSQPGSKKNKAKTTTQKASKASARPVQNGSESIAENSNGKKEASRRTAEPAAPRALPASDKKPDKKKATSQPAPAPARARRTTKVAAVTSVKKGQTKKKGS